MALGSPVHSPPHHQLTSPGVAPVGAHNHSGFLPGFLMGDASSPPPQTPSRILSPTKLNRSLSHHQQQQQSQVSTPRFNKSSRGTPAAEKTPGGPPITGLYSKVGGTPQGRDHLLQTPKNGFHTPIPTTPQLSFGATPDRDEVSPWITIFGFPPSATGYILSQFSQYGVYTTA
ncbi:NUP35 [Lepeophtheirus salmonis]|uniref:Nucleoporin NUP35 n=1 Tax=Lepeophtheirus salmonis TaxID=72036 RepID=A0A7R8HDW8_LEPSM|nr:NUP35 [Lepeophtheirus salmonis]CAF3030968.1 NUP35 [Lepeophtheirus salmonis]